MGRAWGDTRVQAATDNLPSRVPTLVYVTCAERAVPTIHYALDFLRNPFVCEMIGIATMF